MKSDQERLKKLLIETVKTFLKDGVKRHHTLAVEGLIGITLDNKDVFLVYVNEYSTGVVGGTAVNDDLCSRDRVDVLDNCDTNWEHSYADSTRFDDRPKDVYLIYINECSTGVVGSTNDDTCIRDTFELLNEAVDECDTNWEHSCDDATRSVVNQHDTQTTQQAYYNNSDINSSETTAMCNIQNGDPDASSVQQPIFINENNHWSTMTGRARGDVTIESQCSNITSVSGDFDEAADDVMPLVIVSYWSEAATQKADFELDRSRTVIKRATEEERRTNLSRDNPQLTLTSNEQRFEVENVMEKVDDQRGQEGCKRRRLCKIQDLLNGDSDKRLTKSAKQKLNQHHTSGGEQSTCRLNKGHVCNMCKKVFSQRLQLVRHKLKHYTSSVEQSAKGNVCFCDICGRGFIHNFQIKRHMRSHTGEKPYTCNVCSSAFGEYGNLTQHMRIHQEEKPYACEVCKKAFRWRHNLTVHMRIHTGEKPYACEVCKRAFRSYHNFSLHKRTHTGEISYKFEVCKKAFYRHNYLTAHMRTHSEEKPYACEVCKRAFRWRNSITAHMRTHTGEKPYACEVCKRAFRRRHNFTVHMRTHRGEKPHACKVCKRAFSRRYSLTRHMHTHRKAALCM